MCVQLSSRLAGSLSVCPSYLHSFWAEKWDKFCNQEINFFHYPEKNCVYDAVGRTYSGTMSTTKYGNECMQWDYSSAGFLPGDDPQNYCRNPQLPNRPGLAAHPWCFVDTDNSTRAQVKQYEECSLTRCGQYIHSLLCFLTCLMTWLYIFWRRHKVSLFCWEGNTLLSRNY